jgi:hypothetical protein
MTELAFVMLEAIAAPPSATHGRLMAGQKIGLPKHYPFVRPVRTCQGVVA